MSGKKSLGIDVQVNEFYSIFKEKISQISKEVYNEIFQKKALEQRISLGLMKFIYKKKKKKVTKAV